MRRMSLMVLLALAMAGPAAAETGRYQFERTEQGLLRLDTRTGAVALCTGEPLQCRESAAAPSRDEIARLEERIAVLERRLEAIERSGAPKEALPSDEEFDRTLGLMERFMRRFMDVIQDFGGGGEPAPPPPQPDRT